MRRAKKKSDSGFGVGTDGTCSYQKEYIETNLSAGVSSRNCYEELRDVIRESLVRHNLLPLPSETGRASPDCPSVSSSHSVPEKKKVRMPNVIARLMGLEELPLEDHGPEKPGKQGGDPGRYEQENSRKLDKKREWKEPEMLLKLDQTPAALVRIDGRKSSNCPKPFFDMDVPMQRISHHLREEMEPRKRKLNEIIESMQLTGLLRNGGSHGDDFWRPRLVNADKKQGEKMKVGSGKFEEFPPIVIIKPIVITKVNRQREKISQEQQHTLERKPKTEEVRKVRISDIPVVKVKTSVMPEMKQLHGAAKKDERDKIVSKKPLSVENHDRKLVPVSRSPAAVKSEKLRKPLDKLNSERERVRHISPKNHISNGLPERERRKFRDERKEKAKRAVQLRPMNKMVDSMRKKDETVLNLRMEKGCVSAIACSPSAHQLGALETKDCSRRNLLGMGESKVVALSEQIPHKIQRDRRSRATKEANQCSVRETLCLVAGSKAKLKQLLLNSTSFLSAAQEYFDIEITRPASSTNYKEVDGNNDKLVMDCVFELMKYESQRKLPHYTITKPHSQKRKTRFLLDVLVEELCKEFEGLLNYQVMNDFCTMDDLYLILERDLLCRRFDISCIWDLGWDCGGLTEEESELVFCQLEMHVLGGLIEETITDLCDR